MQNLVDHIHGTVSEDTERIMKEHGWLISRKTAELIATRGETIVRRKARIPEIISGIPGCNKIGAIEGKVERVLGRFSMGKDGDKIFRRSIILEEDGSSIVITLWGKHAELPDSIPIRRGDTVEIRNLSLRELENDYVLESTIGTCITRTSKGSMAITDFSSLRYGDKDVDVGGKLVMVENAMATSSGKMPEARSIIVSDGKLEARIVVWGFQSSCVEEIGIHSTIIAESVSVKRGESEIEINAGSSSRILVLKNIQ